MLGTHTAALVIIAVAGLIVVAILGMAEVLTGDALVVLITGLAVAPIAALIGHAAGVKQANGDQ